MVIIRSCKVLCVFQCRLRRRIPSCLEKPVTRFLMACSDCQKRMHLSMNENNNNHKTKTSVNKEQCNSSKSSNNEAQATTNSTLLHHRPLYQHPATADPSLIDYSLPITTTYLNHLRAKGEPTHPEMPFFCHEKDVSK